MATVSAIHWPAPVRIFADTCKAGRSNMAWVSQAPRMAPVSWTITYGRSAALGNSLATPWRRPLARGGPIAELPRPGESCLSAVFRELAAR